MGEEAGRPTSVVRVRSITVRSDRLVLDTVVAGEPFAYTNPQVIRKVLKTHPHLLEHACVNGEGDTFAAVANHTSTPHLLEHLVVDGQAAALAASDPSRNVTFTGKTQWTNRAALEARVEVSYVDDRAALTALRDALATIDEAFMGQWGQSPLAH